MEKKITLCRLSVGTLRITNITIWEELDNLVKNHEHTLDNNSASGVDSALLRMARGLRIMSSAQDSATSYGQWELETLCQFEVLVQVQVQVLVQVLRFRDSWDSALSMFFRSLAYDAWPWTSKLLTLLNSSNRVNLLHVWLSSTATSSRMHVSRHVSRHDC